jgi:hypothetical protein
MSAWVGPHVVCSRKRTASASLGVPVNESGTSGGSTGGGVEGAACGWRLDHPLVRRRYDRLPRELCYFHAVQVESQQDVADITDVISSVAR